MSREKELSPYEEYRYSQLRENYPYGFIVRKSDGMILFFNREYAPLQEKFVAVPDSVTQQITTMTSINRKGDAFHTYWFYDDGNAPANNMESHFERVYLNKMRTIGNLLEPYAYPYEMRFASHSEKHVDLYGME